MALFVRQSSVFEGFAVMLPEGRRQPCKALNGNELRVKNNLAKP
jgi:hypothetical protein